MITKSASALFGVASKLFLTFVALWTACMIGLAVFHTYEIYSPVPVYDMWEGYLGFYQKLAAGDASIWWAQHYEHRIVLGRLLFWADIRWFHGTGIFLLAANYVLLALIAFVLWQVLKRQLPQYETKTTRTVIALFFCAWLCLLCQGENLTWAFQGVFHFSFLLPLSALYCLDKSLTDNARAYFLLACALGVLAYGSMANAALTLPLLSMFAILMGMRKSRIFVLISLAVILTALYFHAYSAPGNHTLLAPEIRQRPSTAILFFLAMLGNPFYFIVDHHQGEYVAELFGGLFLLATLYKAVGILRRPRSNSLHTALLLFVLYIMIAALGVTGGRMFFGLDQALTLRYTTPAIVGWAALVAIYSSDFAVLSAKGRASFAVVALVLAGLMLQFQAGSLGGHQDFYFQRNLAALSLSLGIDDQDKLGALGDPTTVPLLVPSIAERAYREHQSVFGLYPFLDVRQQLGSFTATSSSVSTCSGALESAEVITDQRFLRISGWILNPARGREPVAIRVLNTAGLQIGYAVTGWHEDIEKSLGTGTYYPGYGGYVLISAAGQKVILQAEDRRGVVCKMNVMLPAMLYSIKPEINSPDEISVDDKQVLPGNEWTRSDFNHTNFHALGFRIYGTYDYPDIRSVSLRLKRGDCLLYRSGRNAGHQFIEVAGQAPVLLPATRDWVILVLASPKMPAEPTSVRFVDGGTGPEEWSAIAVRDTLKHP